MLQELFELRQEIDSKKGEIEKIRREYKLDTLEKELELMERDLQSQCQDAVDDGKTTEGTLWIIDNPIKRRIPQRQAVRSAYQEWFEEHASVKLKELKDLLLEEALSEGLDPKAAKAIASERLNEMCDEVLTHRWDVVDLSITV